MSETLTIQKGNALSAFDKADKTQQELLKNLFGEKTFSREISDRIKSFDDAVALVGLTDNQKILIGYNGTDKEMLAAKAFMKLSIIRKALNEGWEPDWDDDDEYKYYPFFDMEKRTTSGSGFAFLGCADDYSTSYVGSRLVFKSEKLAKYAGTQFLDLYRQIFIL